MTDPIGGWGDLETTDDALLNGRLIIRQPVKGHRVGSDAILLAAAAPLEDVGHFADIGAGVGAVGLAMLQRAAAARADLIEKDAILAALARDNAMRNDLAARARVYAVDVMAARERRGVGLIDASADLVVTNPPFFEARRVRASPHSGKASAHVLDESPATALEPPLESWIRACLALLRAGGRFVMIHRPEALGQILGAFERRLGAAAILPVYPNAHSPAHRILVAGVKGARGPTGVRPGLVLHDASGTFTPLAEALHRGAALIDWGETGRRRASKAPAEPR